MPTIDQCERAFDEARYAEAAAYYDDDDRLTPEQAAEDAEDELLSTPAVVADTLARLCDPGWDTPGAARPGCDPIDVRTLCQPELDADVLSAHELLAVAMTGRRDEALRALLALRDRVRDALAADIKERAAEMLAEDRAVREWEDNADWQEAA